MSQELWTKVDHYIEQHVIPEDPALEAAVADSGSEDAMDLVTDA